MNPLGLRQQLHKQREDSRLARTWSWHARARARELGFAEAKVEACVQHPEQSYPSHPSYGLNRRTYQCDSIAVVLHEPTGRIVTVLLRTARQWKHGDDNQTLA